MKSRTLKDAVYIWYTLSILIVTGSTLILTEKSILILGVTLTSIPLIAFSLYKAKQHFTKGIKQIKNINK
ncbi:hypothetical protein EVU96_09110 [Bacillus infantis]|uniref:hypothetical protein n=1 Tax=Bacillus infantis TaxID=324767 RepID=UPI00101BC2AF|nr:hypothetical protein [Bacillus infantis]RYI30564.1 hypothetical protein EVU96_09110 [Bacillus infantis]